MYSTTTDLVADVSLYYDNTDLSTVQNATTRQNKIMQYVNRVRDELWWSRPWPWTMSQATVNMSSGQANAPSDFGQVGPQGGLYSQSNGRPWTEINYQEMLTLRKRSIRVNDKLFTIGAQEGSGTLGILIPNTGSSEAFDLVYRMRPTNLTYGQGLAPLPTHFGHALLLGVVARLKEEEGDPRPIWRNDYNQALSRAYMTERETASRQGQMPMAVGRKW